MVTVRFFAAAREAAGTPETTVEAATAAELTDALEAAFGPRMAQVLAVSSLMASGRRLLAADELAPDSQIDVLPPFAGG